MVHRYCACETRAFSFTKTARDIRPGAADGATWRAQYAHMESHVHAMKAEVLRGQHLATAAELLTVPRRYGHQRNTMRVQSALA